MKKYLLYTMLFIIPIWIVLLGADDSLSHRIRCANSSFSQPLYDMYNVTDSFDILICGNSRASVQYNPFILDSILECNSYNLGYDGCAVNIQLVKYEQWCKYHSNPKYIIYNIDLWTMNETRGNNREQIFPYFTMDRNLMKNMDIYHDYTIAEKFIPFSRYIGHKNMIEGVLVDSISFYKGYYGFDWEWQQTNVRHNQDLYKCACDSNMIELFCDFIEKQQVKNIEILFVYAPMFHTILKNSPDIQKMYDMYGNIANQYNIAILDYNTEIMCQDSTLFYNKMHLNQTGSELFTKKLAHDIDSIGFLKK